MQFQSGAVSPIGSIEEGWRIIKDDYWLFFGMTTIAIIILIAAGFMLSIINSAIANGIALALGLATRNAGDVARVSASIAPSLISLVISIFTDLIVITLSGALFCGIYSALSRKANTGVVEFGDLFTGFQKIQSCLIVAVIMSLVGFIVGIVMLLGGAAVGVGAIGTGMLIQDGKLNPALLGGVLVMAGIFMLIYLIINLIITALTMFVYPLIGERNLRGGEAVMLSIKSGFSNLFGLILLIILSFLMAIGGALLCLVGVLFVAPIIYASYFAAFQSVFGRVARSGFQNPPPPPTFR